MKSLRQIYAESKPASVNKKLLDSFSERKNPERKIYESIICPICLKSIVIAKLDFTCPFCDKEYKAIAERQIDGNDLMGLFGVAIGTSLSSFAHEKALLECCGECHAEIKYLSCPHCKNKVDLFAPYDYEELKRKRHE